MKQFLILPFLIISVLVHGQYDPSKATTTNKPLGIAQGVPTDARSYYYSPTLFIWRPYQSTAEVLSTLNIAKFRMGHFPIYVNSGGTLNSNGTFTGGTIKEYWFKDGTTDADLVEKTGGTVVGSGDANNSGTIAQLQAMSTTTGRAYFATDMGGGSLLDIGPYDGQVQIDNKIYVLTANNKVLQRQINGEVDVRWFGAVGNALYVNGNAGSPTQGKAFQNSALTIPAHDDTQAFKDAIKFINGSSHPMYSMVAGTPYGWNGSRLKLVVPTGNWYITSGKILTDVGMPGGANGGFVIEGTGPKNSIIVYSNSSTATDEFLFYDNDKFPTMIFRDFSVQCYTGKEKIFYQTSQGNSQNYSFSNIEARGYKEFYEVGGQFNADKTEFRRITAASYEPGNSFFTIKNNSQSVAHALYECDIITAGAGSSMFNIQAGSSISIYGGSYTADIGATMYKIAPPDPTGTWIANFSIPIATFGSRVEVWHDAKYIDTKTGNIIINSEEITNFPESDGKEKIIIRKEGTVHFEKCTFANIKIGFEVENGITWQRDTKPTVIFTDCSFPDGDFTSTNVTNYVDYNAGTLVTFFPNNAGLGRIITRNSRTYGSVTNSFNDGAPDATKGFSSITYEKRIAIATASPNPQAGLPQPGTTATIKIPLGCVVIKVGIVKNAFSLGGAQNVQRWWVKDGNNNNVVRLTTEAPGDEISAYSGEMWQKVTTDGMRTFTLYADPANSNTYAEGYFVVEYM